MGTVKRLAEEIACGLREDPLQLPKTAVKQLALAVRACESKDRRHLPRDWPICCPWTRSVRSGVNKG